MLKDPAQLLKKFEPTRTFANNKKLMQSYDVLPMHHQSASKSKLSQSGVLANMNSHSQERLLKVPMTKIRISKGTANASIR